ncbi:MAG: hypothetical protein ABI947_16955 [Chloroflexota bacterium]
MSNKQISVYVEAKKREQEEQVVPSPRSVPVERPAQKSAERIPQTTPVIQETVHTPMLPSHHDTVLPHYRDTTVALICKGVKKFGKEPATHRFTLEEKRAIRDIIRAFEDRDIRTGETEITRIGIHFLIDDYEHNREDSLLVKILKALHE